jgi:glycerate 2-kinase
MGLAFYHKLFGQNLSQKLYFLCGGTDGQDGPTDAAGVIVENMDQLKDSEEIFKQSAIDLENHNSHEFFAKYHSNWLIRTGITGTNVMDIYCMIRPFNI